MEFDIETILLDTPLFSYNMMEHLNEKFDISSHDQYVFCRFLIEIKHSKFSKYLKPQRLGQ